MIEQLATWAGMGAFTILVAVAGCWLIGAAYVIILVLVDGPNIHLGLPHLQKRFCYTSFSLLGVTLVCIMIGCVGETIVQLSSQ